MVLHRRQFQRRFVLFLILVGVAEAIAILEGQRPAGQPTSVPRATLAAATPLRLTGDVDSNSPAVWERVNGRAILHIVTSAAGAPSLAVGLNLQRLSVPTSVNLMPWPPGGNWIEAVVPDVDGTWYGFYHNEHAADFCEGTTKVFPRIGAARSIDNGRIWEDLGILLEAGPRSAVCGTTNEYFVGGVGDFSVVLDADQRYLYVFFSQYPGRQEWQGVSAARFLWADRDEPIGKLSVWREGLWLPGRSVLQTDEAQSPVVCWVYPTATPIYPAAASWHDASGTVEAFWGPSVHWNTHLEQYVMLLNNARDTEWTQEGIYVAFAPRLDDPGLWSVPVKILDGGSWYPQVIGTEIGVGSDKTAGQLARFFMAGHSEYFIRFDR